MNSIVKAIARARRRLTSTSRPYATHGEIRYTDRRVSYRGDGLLISSLGRTRPRELQQSGIRVTAARNRPLPPMCQGMNAYSVIRNLRASLSPSQNSAQPITGAAPKFQLVSNSLSPSGIASIAGIHR